MERNRSVLHHGWGLGPPGGILRLVAMQKPRAKSDSARKHRAPLCTVVASTFISVPVLRAAGPQPPLDLRTIIRTVRLDA